MKKVNTARLIITSDCNLNCSYCCNNVPEVKQKFVRKSLNEINFNDYETVCITGGEPFLDLARLQLTMESIPADKNVYIYTNGLKLFPMLYDIMKFPHFKGLNVGLHSITQLDLIPDYIDRLCKTRYHIQDKFVDDYLQSYPVRLNSDNIKLWTLNQCTLENEDWFLVDFEDKIDEMKVELADMIVNEDVDLVCWDEYNDCPLPEKADKKLQKARNLINKIREQK